MRTRRTLIWTFLKQCQKWHEEDKHLKIVELEEQGENSFAISAYCEKLLPKHTRCICRH